MLLAKPKISRSSGQTKVVPQSKSDFTEDWNYGEIFDRSYFDDLDESNSDGSDFEGPDFDDVESESNDDDGDIK